MPANWHRVERATTLIQILNSQQLAAQIQTGTRFGHAVFKRDCQPVVDAVADYVQRLPTKFDSSSEPLLPRALRICDIALKLRLGELLPPSAPAEELHRREHRWTYGVFLAALLGELAHLCTNYAVQYKTSLGHQYSWLPLAGSLRDMHAIAYCVSGSEAQHKAQSSSALLPLTLLQSVTPRPVRQWLAEDVELMNCLCAALCAPPAANPIGSLVQHARNEVDRRAQTAAKHVPLDRFVAATATHDRTQDGSTAVAQSSAGPGVAMSPTQQDLFSAEGDPEQTDAGAAWSDAPADRVWLFSTTDSLSPLLKQTLTSIESDLKAQATKPIQILSEYGFLVALEEFERRGTDIGFAITCLSKAGMLLPNVSDPGKTIHTLHTAERTSKAVAIRAHRREDSCGGQNPRAFDEAFLRAPTIPA